MAIIIGGGAILGLLVALFILIPTNRLRGLAVLGLAVLAASVVFLPRQSSAPLQMPIEISEGVPPIDVDVGDNDASPQEIEAEVARLSSERLRLEEERATLRSIFDDMPEEAAGQLDAGDEGFSFDLIQPGASDTRGMSSAEIQGLNLRRALLEVQLANLEQELDQATEALEAVESRADMHPLIDGSASVAHDLPMTMRYRDSVHVRLVVAPSTLGRSAAEFLTDPEGTEVDIVVRQFETTVLMRADLHSSDFEIESTLSTEQRALPDREMNWEWIIVPRRGGEDLRLSFSLEAVIGNGESKHFSSFPPLAATIVVTTTLWDRALLALAEIETAEAVLSGLIATLLAVAGFGVKYLAGRSRRDEEDQEPDAINIVIHDGDPPRAPGPPHAPSQQQSP